MLVTGDSQNTLLSWLFITGKPKSSEAISSCEILVFALVTSLSNSAHATPIRRHTPHLHESGVYSECQLMEERCAKARDELASLQLAISQLDSDVTHLQQNIAGIGALHICVLNRGGVCVCVCVRVSTLASSEALSHHHPPVW